MRWGRTEEGSSGQGHSRREGSKLGEGRRVHRAEGKAGDEVQKVTGSSFKCFMISNRERKKGMEREISKCVWCHSNKTNYVKLDDLFEALRVPLSRVKF